MKRVINSEASVLWWFICVISLNPLSNFIHIISKCPDYLLLCNKSSQNLVVSNNHHLFCPWKYNLAERGRHAWSILRVESARVIHAGLAPGSTFKMAHSDGYVSCRLGAQPGCWAGGLDTFHSGNSCMGSLGFLTAWQLAHKHNVCRAKRKGTALLWSNLVTLLHSIGQGGHLINLITRREDCPSDTVRTRGTQSIGLTNLKKKKTQSRQANWVLES